MNTFARLNILLYSYRCLLSPKFKTKLAFKLVMIVKKIKPSSTYVRGNFVLWGTENN